MLAWPQKTAQTGIEPTARGLESQAAALATVLKRLSPCQDRWVVAILVKPVAQELRVAAGPVAPGAKRRAQQRRHVGAPAPVKARQTHPRAAWAPKRLLLPHAAPFHRPHLTIEGDQIITAEVGNGPRVVRNRRGDWK